MAIATAEVPRARKGRGLGTPIGGIVMDASQGPAAAPGRMKTVYTVVERGPGKSFWCKVGIGFVNRDGSINLRLDAVPVNGTLQVREYEPPSDDKHLPGPMGGQRRFDLNEALA